jgi:hypothetical protein
MVSQEALTRLLIEKGIFTKEEFLEMEMVKAVDRERKKNLLIQNHISLEVTNER